MKQLCTHCVVFTLCWIHVMWFGCRQNNKTGIFSSTLEIIPFHVFSLQMVSHPLIQTNWCLLLVSPGGTGWQWGGCSDNVEFGEAISKQFVDTLETGQDARAAMNLHNNEAGRKVQYSVNFTYNLHLGDRRGKLSLNNIQSKKLWWYSEILSWFQIDLELGFLVVRKTQIMLRLNQCNCHRRELL